MIIHSFEGAIAHCVWSNVSSGFICAGYQDMVNVNEISWSGIMSILESRYDHRLHGVLMASSGYRRTNVAHARWHHAKALKSWLQDRHV